MQTTLHGKNNLALSKQKLYHWALSLVLCDRSQQIRNAFRLARRKWPIDRKRDLRSSGATSIKCMSHHVLFLPFALPRACNGPLLETCE